MPQNSLTQKLISSWEDNITARLTKRLLKHLANEKGESYHPEAVLPKPKYIIALNVEEIVDLAPYYLKKGGKHG